MTKDKLLALLETNKGEWLSGESIAAEFSVSRAAVWKAVMGLRKDGYVIDAVRKKGYRLSEETDILSELGIWKFLSRECSFLDLHVMDEVGSTNTVLWQKEKEGYPEGTVLLAAMQTDGKGRLGRRFYSPAETGVYMSILLRPVHMEPIRAVRITTMAAAAACTAIEEVSGRSAGIKWVNDIYVENLKVCGILTEGSVSMENGLMDAVVLGVGINAYEPENGFPAELRGTAGAVFRERVRNGRNRLAAAFLNRFVSLYRNAAETDYVSIYRSKSLVIGKEISVILPERTRNALALDIDDECRLLVRYEDGTTERLTSGEISIRL